MPWHPHLLLPPIPNQPPTTTLPRLRTLKQNPVSPLLEVCHLTFLYVSLTILPPPSPTPGTELTTPTKKLSHPLLAKCFSLNLPGFSPVTGNNGTAANATTTLAAPPFVNGTATGTGTSVAVVTSALETLVPVSTLVGTSVAASTSAVAVVVRRGRY